MSTSRRSAEQAHCIQPAPSSPSARSQPVESVVSLADVAGMLDIALSDAVEGVCLVGPDSRVVWANKVAAKAVGQELADLVGMPCHDIWRDVEAPCPGCPAIQPFEVGKEHVLEIRSRSGGCWTFRDFPLKGFDGKATGVVKFAREVTGRTTAEAAGRTEERFPAVQGAIRIKPERTLIDPAPAAVRILGYGSPEELLEELSEDERRSLLNPERSKEMKELALQSEKLRLVGGLVAEAVHEINNPLSVIMASALLIRRRLSSENRKNRELAEQCGLDLEKVQEYLKKTNLDSSLEWIVTAAQRSAATLRNMRVFCECGDPRTPMLSVTEALNHVRRHAASDGLKNDDKTAAIDVELSFGPDLPDGPVSGPELGKALLGLARRVGLAMSGDKQRRDKPILTLRSERDANGLRIEAQDREGSLAEEARKEFAKSSLLAKDDWAVPGNDLIIARHVVEKLYGGTLTISSETSGVTLFTIHLPLAATLPA